MAQSIRDQVSHSIKDAQDLYYQLVLLVGESGSGKTGVLQAVAEEFGTSVINLNLVLSSELLELTAKQRTLRLREILNQIAVNAQPPVFLDNLEILFDKALGQDPLRLLQGISRNRTIIASWSGTNIGRRLSYAATGHAENRCYDSVDGLIVRMDNTVTNDSATNAGQQGQA